MSTPLEEIAETADAVADDQREIARRARRMQGLRDRGWSWSDILEREPLPGLVERLTRSTRRLVDGAAAFRERLAQQLAGEGWTRRRIARVLGVTHQRVSAILTNGRART